MRLPLPINYAGMPGGAFNAAQASNLQNQILATRAQNAPALQRAQIANLYMQPAAQVLGNPFITSQMSASDKANLLATMSSNLSSQNPVNGGGGNIPLIPGIINYLTGLVHGHALATSAGSTNALSNAAPNGSPSGAAGVRGGSITPSQNAIQQAYLGSAAHTQTSPGSSVTQLQQLKNLNSVLPQAQADINQVGPVGNLLHELTGFSTPGYRKYQTGVNMLHPYGASLGIVPPALSTFGGGSGVSGNVAQNVNALNQ
jgi:hypothetical protein